MDGRKKLALRLLGRTRIEAPGDCWPWLGCVSDSGHGRIWSDGRTERAHRVSYRLFVGSIPKNDVVRHMCDRPDCVNPNHLELGSTQQNHADMCGRRRNRSGWAKLTPESVLEARERLSLGEPMQDVAKRLAVTVGHLRRIERRDIWESAEEMAEGSKNWSQLDYGVEIPF